MLIDSFPYIFSLLALSFIYYLLRSARQQNYFLLFFSLSFYIYLTQFWSIILFSTMVITTLAITLKNKRFSFIAIGFILGQFIYLKQFIPDLSILANESFLFPIGLSFFTFQAISLVIDNKQLKNTQNLKISDIFLFLAYFPQLTAGPIEKGSELIPQLQKKRHFSPLTIETSLIRIGSGFLKKFIVANVIAQVLMEIKESQAISFPQLLLLPIFCRYFIYSNFSAYTDIALGSSALFGIKLTENFKYPLQSKNLTEFWQRWHISLSRWVKSYIYFPLAINLMRKNLPVMIATVVSFLLIGLWHGLSTNFVIYGLIQALFVILESRFPVLSFEKGQPFIKRYLVGSIYRYLVFMAPSILFFFGQQDFSRMQSPQWSMQPNLALPLITIMLWELTSTITKKWQSDFSMYFNQVSLPLRILIYLAAFTLFVLAGRHHLPGSFLYFYF